MHLGLQGGNVILHCKPNLGDIDAKVVADQLVSHSCDVHLGDRGMGGAEPKGKPLDGFSDDLNLADYTVLNQRVTGELAVVNSGGVFQDTIYCIEDVLQVECVVTRHRSDDAP